MTRVKRKKTIRSKRKREEPSVMEKERKK